MGIIVFNDDTQLVVNFNQYANVDLLSNAIQSIAYNPGLTNSQAYVLWSKFNQNSISFSAFQRAFAMFGDASTGARQTSKKANIYFSDGRYCSIHVLNEIFAQIL